jgi:hypothetical protein
VDNGDGTATVHLTGELGVVTITAHQAGDGNYDPAPDVVQTFNVIFCEGLPQAINFLELADKCSTDDDFEITATSTSGLTVSFTITGPATLDDHGDGTATVHLTGALGTVEITAHQAGNESFAPAPDVVRQFEVNDCSVVQDCTIDTAIPEMQFDPASQQNVIIVGGILTRDGGVVGSSDAFADGLDWVEGDGCAYWEWTIRNDLYVAPGNGDEECNLVNYFIYPEDGSTGVYGWGFTNAIQSFRRSPFLNSVSQFPIYFRNFPLGFNKFAIQYNNGTVRLLETDEFATEDPGFIPPESYAASGLPTTTRWRLRVTVKNGADCRSSKVRESIAGRIVIP